MTQARAKNQPIDTLPDRIDMNVSEIVSLMNTPMEEVLSITQEELHPYGENDTNNNSEDH